MKLHNIYRYQNLRRALLFGFLTLSSSLFAAEKIVIIGGGLSGLTTLHRLGGQATLFEQGELGGRIFAEHNAFGLGLTLNGGAELIDTNHQAIIELANEFGIKVVPRWQAESSQQLQNGIGVRKVSQFIINPQLRETETEFFQRIFETEKRPLERMFKDQVSIDEQGTKFGDPRPLSGLAYHLDHMSAFSYISQIGAGKELTSYFSIGLESELGRKLLELSALVLFENFKVDLDKKSIVFLPENDEERLIEGGTHRLIDAMAEKYKRMIRTGHQLFRVVYNQSSKKFSLYFKRSLDRVQIIRADKLVLALPPYEIAQLQWIGMAPPPVTQLKNIQYAQSSKLALLFTSNPFENQLIYGRTKKGHSFQAWDSSHNSRGYGVLMVYLGAIGQQSPDDLVKDLLATLEKLNSNFKFLGYELFAWNKSYTTADRPGDRSRYHSVRIQPGKNIFVVGEFADHRHQGYMNAAVISAEQAASQILSPVRSGSSKKCTQL